MAFVCKRITEGTHPWQIIDAGRNARMVSIGGLGPEQSGMQFRLEWRGDIVEFDAPSEFSGGEVKNNLRRITWSVCNLRMPHMINSQVDEIKNLIKDALIAYTHRNESERERPVIVKFLD